MSALRVLPGSAPRESDSGAGLARVGACPFGARASAEAEGGNRARECPRQDWSRRNPVRRGGHHAPVAPLPTPRRPPSRTGRSRATAWDGVRLSAANRDRLLLKTPSPGPPFGTGPENPRIQTIPAFRVRAARSRPHHRLIQCGAQPPQFFHSHRPTHGISDTPELPQPTPVIDRSCANRLPLSTGAPATDPRYRPELPPQTPVIDRSSRRRLPLSTGAPAADPRYRPELLQPTPVIDRSSRRRLPLSTGASTTDSRYRPELPPQTPFIDRSSRRRSPLSTGAPAADSRYRPELPPQTPVIDRSSRHRPPLSTGASATDPLYRPELPPQIPVIDRSCQETPRFTQLGDTYFYAPEVVKRHLRLGHLATDKTGPPDPGRVDIRNSKQRFVLFAAVVFEPAEDVGDLGDQVARPGGDAVGGSGNADQR